MSRNARARRPAAHISIAFVTGVILVPLVIATGLMTDRGLVSPTEPKTSALDLRGSLDGPSGALELRGPLPL